MKRGLNIWLLTGMLVAVLGATGATQKQAPVQDGRIYEAGKNGVSWPTVIKQVEPHYTTAALRAKIEGTVQLRAIVKRDGRVDRVTVTKSLDARYGLDTEAIKAAKRWVFNPGKKDGKPVAVSIPLELEFRLDNRP